LYTTVQDLGRPGHRAAGVPAGGAADSMAFRVANLAVGNPPDAAVLECTLTGPGIRFGCDVIVAFAGAAFSGLPSGRPFHVRAGSVLEVGHAVRGCRGYLAVAGGIDVPEVLGSRSTYGPAICGGFHGRALVAGDRLKLGVSRRRTTGTNWRIAPDLTPLPDGRACLRLVREAPVDSRVWEASFRVTARSDRMGVRLAGPSIQLVGDGMSVAVLPGTVQVPPDGQPIILLADAQTIGGYPVLGQAIAADLPLAAQLRPGDVVRFLPVEAAEARGVLRSREASLSLARLGLSDRTLPVIAIDLSADVGEGTGTDAEIVPLVSSVNIACGGHAGDLATMRTAVALAVAHGVTIGAHPGYEARDYFGRRPLSLPTPTVAELVFEQVERLAAVVFGELSHVKLHGALYHQAARDRKLADAIASRLARSFPGLAIVGPAGSCLSDAALTLGLRFVREAFVDRGYAADSTLLARSSPGAVFNDPVAAGSQAVSIARDGRVTAADGSTVAVVADTLCVHGDGTDAVGCLQAVRAALAAAAVDILAVPRKR